jgi:hypothetical integral membrane protein (TIGR02206 family)
MFSQEHFIWMGICVLFIAVLSYVSIKYKFSFKTAAFIMAAISLASEISKILSHMTYVNGENAADGMVIEASSLPFHLCSLLIFAYFYFPFAKNEKLKKFLLGLVVPIGLIGATLAIVMATSGVDFAKVYAYQCFIYHSGMIWFSIYLIACKAVDLGLKVWVRNLISLFATCIVMIWVNGLLQAYDTNFWFVVRPPRDGLPLLNLDNGWYAYFFTIVGLGFVLVSLVHLPFIIKERKALKNKD